MTASPEQPHIGLIVEGPGDHGAVPTLFRRGLHLIGEFRDILGSPLACNGVGNITTPGGIERFVAIAAARPGCAAIIVVLDSDGQCPVALANDLLPRTACRVPVTLVVADLDFEDWLYAGVESLGLEGEPVFTSGTRGKSVIAGAFSPFAYTKPQHQPKLAGRLDLTLARERSRSLDRALDRLEAAASTV